MATVRESDVQKKNDLNLKMWNRRKICYARDHARTEPATSYREFKTEPTGYQSVRYNDVILPR